MIYNAQARRCVFSVILPLVCGCVALPLFSGCVNDTPALPDPHVLPDSAAQTLEAGETTVHLASGTAGLYQVEVPAGKTLRVTGRSASGTPVDLGAIQAPDGEVVDGYTESRTSSSAQPVRATALTEGERNIGFRFAGTADTGGVWRFSMLNLQADARQAVSTVVNRESWVTNLLLYVYLLNSDRPSPANDALGRLVQILYPGAQAVVQPVDVTLKVEFVTAAEAVQQDAANPDSTPDGSNSGTGDNTDGNSDDATNNTDGTNNNGGGTDGNSGDAGGNNNDNGGGDSSNGGNDNNDSGGNSGDNNNGGNNDDGNTDNGGDNDDGTDNGQSDGGNTNPTQIVLQRIVQTGDPVPGQPSTARFTFFGNPIVDADGRIAFWARYTQGQGDSGLYVWDNGTVKRVVDDNPTPAARGAVPGRGPNDYFGDFNVQANDGSQPMAWGAGGRLLFAAPSRGATSWRGLYRWRATDGNLIRVADLGQMAALFPDAQTGTFSCDFLQSGVSDAGLALFTIRYTYIKQDRSFVLGKRGVFTSNGSSIALVADPQLTPAGGVPDQAAAARFDQFESLTTLNAGGDMLLQGSYFQGNGDHGIYLAADGGLFRVLDNGTGRTFPGLSAGATVGETGKPFDDIAIGGNGDIAVKAKLTVGGTPRDAVLLWNGQQWRELTGTGGTAATALLGGLNNTGQALFLAGNIPYLSTASGAVDLAAVLPGELLGADLQWEADGGALNNNGRALVRYTRAIDENTATPGLAFWTGGKLLIVADPALSLPANTTRLYGVAGPELDRPGRSGALNDRDEAVFRIAGPGPDGQDNTADDVQAVYVGRYR